MTESIGTARIDLVVNTDGMQAGIEAAKRSVSGMSAAAQQEYNKLNTAEKRRVDSLIRQVDTLNLTRQGQLAYNAALKTSGSVQAELLARIKATEAATKSGTAALNQYGISAKQSAAAMRGVPAQITDIFTSLQGGQNPLTVLLQQGGQLKDMFGGIVPAARALGGALAGLINPVTVTAAAAAALTVAWAKGQRESERFNEALILTGNYAGTTAADLAALASQMDGLAGVTTSSAAEALATVAATGKFTGEQIGLVATAAEQMRDATGKAIEETVAEFEELRKDPVKAILDLNDKYHFLTQAQFDRIQALKEEGREQEAVTEAIKVYADTLSGRTGDITANLGLIERGWRAIKNTAREALDELLSVGRFNLSSAMGQAQFNRAGAVEQLQTISRNLDAEAKKGADASQARVDAAKRRIQELKGIIAESNAVIGRGVTGSGKSPAVDSAAIRERQKAQEEFDRLELSNLDKKAKLEREIADIREVGAKAGKSEADIEAQIANARKRYQESLPKGSRRKSALTDEQRDAKQLQRQYESLTEQLDRQIALFDDTSRAAAVRYDTELGGLAKLSQAQKDGLIAQAEKLDAMKKEKELTEDLKRLREDLAATELGRSRANEADLLGLSGVGREEFERIQRRLEIEQEYQDRVADLIAGGLEAESEGFRQQEAELRAHRDRSLTVEEDYQQKRAALMGDWRTGATAALNDFVADQANVAGQMYDIWSGAFDGLADVITDFLTKGKGDFKGFLNALAADITEFVVKQQLSKFFQSMMSGDQGGGGNGGQMIGTLLSMFGGGWGGIAMGGAFGGGQRIDKYAMGGVFDQATMFQHGGKLGVLGEAGPEAIMPLSRGRDGKLGVKVDQRDAPRGPAVVNQQFTQVVQGQMTMRTAEQAARENGRQAARAMTRTGR